MSREDDGASIDTCTYISTIEVDMGGKEEFGVLRQGADDPAERMASNPGLGA